MVVGEYSARPLRLHPLEFVRAVIRWCPSLDTRYLNPDRLGSLHRSVERKLPPAGQSAVTRSTLDAGLIFTRTVEELPVVGPGGMVMVKIGTDESVVGVVRSGGQLLGERRKLI